MPTKSYAPFRDGEVSTGSSAKCACGAVKNQHSLRQAGQCDWLKKPKKEKDRILTERRLREEAAA